MTDEKNQNTYKLIRTSASYGQLDIILFF